MRLTITEQDTNRHTEACTSVHTSLGGELLTGGDDGAVWRWNGNGEPIGKICDVDSGVTVVKWMPGSGRKKGAEAARDAAVVACCSGFFYFVAVQTGRIEKAVEAHTGAITGLAWNPDGSTMVTAGEDGVVKVWSQAGIHRSTLASTGKCIYCLVWGTESSEYNGEAVLYTTGSDVIVKPLNPSVKKVIQWKAHSDTVLCADWSRMTNLIVTGGEDGAFCVWDAYGRNLYSFTASSYPTTSIGFAPDGEMFAVGSFQSVRVCDRTGWTHCREETSSGSNIALCWTPDSTQVALGGGSGALSVAQLVDRKMHWRQLTCTLTDNKKLHIQDVASDQGQELEHRDKIIKLSVGYGYVVVATTTQCVVYDVQKWNTPLQFDLRDIVVSLQQCAKGFYIADCAQGVVVYNYDARQKCAIKFSATIRPEALSTNLVSLSEDTVAIRDPADVKKIVFYDAQNGRLFKDVVVTHHMDIMEISLSQYGAMQERKLAFIDRNRDLYITTVHVRRTTQKLATMVSSAAWNDTTETLVALADGRLVTWYYPAVVFVDRDLLARTKSISYDNTEEFGRNDQITDFFGTRLSVRRGHDGALLTFSVSPYPDLLYTHITKKDWEGATRLCRYLKEDALWGILAALAIKNSQLITAEVAYAALEEVDKLRFISGIKEIPSSEGRQAELALFQRRLEDAERILLQANLTWRCIEMHINLHSWDRALQIAFDRQTHLDSVLGFRQKYLESIGGRKETIEKFRQVEKSTKVDWNDINNKIKEEKNKEKQRGTPYTAN